MNMAFARTRYRQAENVGHPPLDDPHQVISVTLRELERSLSVIAASIDAGSQAPSDHTNRALTAVYVLQSSLDFEKGADIATTLFEVYEFVRLQVLKVFQRDDTAEIHAARDAIIEIYSAWKDIGPKATDAEK